MPVEEELLPIQTNSSGKIPNLEDNLPLEVENIENCGTEIQNQQTSDSRQELEDDQPIIVDDFDSFGDQLEFNKL